MTNSPPEPLEEIINEDDEEDDKASTPVAAPHQELVAEEEQEMGEEEAPAQVENENKPSRPDLSIEIDEVWKLLQI